MVPAKPRILFVDDEPDLLAGMERSLRSEHFGVTTAPSGALALAAMRRAGPFAVIVSDLRMPEMDGVTLLRTARELFPDTVRVLFTGQPDMDRAIAAVNEGEIFRFVTKPCSRVMMALTLKGAIEQNRLITSERVLLEQTLHGSIKALTDVLGLASPMAFGRATRLRHAVSGLIAAMAIPCGWHVEVAAMLSQIGHVILPQTTLEKVYKGELLTEAEKAMIERIPAVTEQVLGNIPRLEPVQEILRYQYKHFDGTGHPADAIQGEQIPWGARALRVACDLDALEGEGLSMSFAFDTLRGRDGWYDPAIVEALGNLRHSEQRHEIRELPLAGVRPGMVLAQDVATSKGVLFLARGQEVTASMVEKLRNFSSSLARGASIRVIVGNLAEGPVLEANSH
jgi:response regulator RpfG family c-di-GMP phosphodiesterase